MLTEKENYLMTLRGETPEWIPRLLIPLRPDMRRLPPGLARIPERPKNAYQAGLTSGAWNTLPPKETGYMSLPKPGPFILDDIRHWRDVIKAPDISHIDWETMAKKDMQRVDRTQTAVTATIHVGYFQQLMNFMGFTEGLCAMLEEPDEVMALFEYMNQFYLQICSKVRDYTNPMPGRSQTTRQPPPIRSSLLRCTGK